MPYFVNSNFACVCAGVCVLGWGGEGACLCMCTYRCVLGVHIKGILKNRSVSKKLLD